MATAASSTACTTPNIALLAPMPERQREDVSSGEQRRADALAEGQT